MVLDPLKRRDDEPTFDEPWQAQVLSMADILVTAGVISADAWARTLGAERGKSLASGQRTMWTSITGRCLPRFKYCFMSSVQRLARK